MDAHPNAFVTVSHKGKRVDVENDGLIPALKRGNDATIIVRQQPRSVYVTVSAEKDITHVHSGEDRLGRYYAHEVSLPAHYEENHIRRVSLIQGTKVRVEEIALIMQGKNTFLTQQVTYEELVFRSSDSNFVVVPRFCRPFTETPWPQMMRVITDLVCRTGKVADLPTKQPKLSLFPKPQLGPHQARVEWFSLANRCGMAMTSTGDLAIILAKDVPRNGSRLRHLEKDSTIRFKHMVPQTDGCPFRLDGIELE